MPRDKKGVHLGPGVLVAAAFIGPGTVTTAVMAGQQFGTALLWALLFATIATIILQDMSGRLGAGAKLGLGEAIRKGFQHPVFGPAMIGLVFLAILVGNAAYEGGNLAGAALGAEALGVPLPRPVIVLTIAAAAALVLLPGRYRLLERVLMGCVALMGIAFVLALILSTPSLGNIARGLVPQAPTGSLLSIIALMGTTIVPYNLFLHASTSKDRWQGEGAVENARLDTIIAIGLGGCLSAIVLLVAASAPAGGEKGVMALFSVLEPTLGSAGKWLLGVGLLAAGLSSAITAPMAAGYVASELFSGEGRSHQHLFRITALSILLIGSVAAALSLRPQVLIVVAQAANGLLLPIVAIFLLIMMNRKDLLGENANGKWSNAAGLLIVAVTIGFGIRGIARALGVWP